MEEHSLYFLLRHFLRLVLKTGMSYKEKCKVIWAMNLLYYQLGVRAARPGPGPGAERRHNTAYALRILHLSNYADK